MSISSQEIKKIAIMRTSALGDILWALPLFYSLRKNFPDTHISWFVDAPFRSLLEEIEGLHLIPLHRPRSLGDYWNCKKLLSPYSFDILLCPQTSLRMNLLCPLICAKRKIGFDSKRSRDGQKFFVNEHLQPSGTAKHNLESHLDFARHLGLTQEQLSYSQSLSLSADIYLQAKNLLRWESWNNHQKSPLIVIHPRASHPFRSWTVEGYQQLILQLQRSRHAKVALTGTAGDALFLQKILSALPHNSSPPVLNLAGKTSPKVLAAIFSQSNLVIAPDTGPLHLACATGVPVVGLYAAVPPTLTGPFGAENFCVNRYPQAVEKFLHKRNNPAREEFSPPRVHHRQIMELIKVEDVLEKVSSALRSKEFPS